MSKSKIFVRQIALPQDHGSWIFIISPLLIGTITADNFTPASIALIISAMAVFLLRQPTSIIVKAFSRRRPRSDLRAAWFWVTLYGAVALLGFFGLLKTGHWQIALLIIPAVPVFTWHLWLVSRRSERKQLGVELIGTGILALAAPGAYWVGISQYDKIGWLLWALVWLQNAASIVYTYSRLEQRSQSENKDRSNHGSYKNRALIYSSFNVILVLILGSIDILPQWVVLPYFFQWIETLWGTKYPATGWSPTRIGVRQLIVSIVWTFLFIITWRF